MAIRIALGKQVAVLSVETNAVTTPVGPMPVRRNTFVLSRTVPSRIGASSGGRSKLRNNSSSGLIGIMPNSAARHARWVT